MSEADVMADFDHRLSTFNLRGQWKSEAFLSAAIGGPRPAGEAARWAWSDVVQMLDEAGEAMPESHQARRSVIFQNPGLQRGTTHTINVGVQMILPGEVAWSHRHSIGALRFVIEGNDQLTTVVDGQHCVMQTGDLLLTPNWAWHDHHNSGPRKAFWLDALDVPLVLGLNQTFYQPGEVEAQPVVDHDLVRGAMRFPWSDALEAACALPVNAVTGQSYEYRDPVSGESCLPTMACRLVRLPPGFAGRPRRTTSSLAGFVVRGAGLLGLSSGDIALQPRDAFVVPNWSWHQLANASDREDLLIFTVSDDPVLRSLGFYRDQSES